MFLFLLLVFVVFCDVICDLYVELDCCLLLGDDDFDDCVYFDYVGCIFGWLEFLECVLCDNCSGWLVVLWVDVWLVKSVWLESDLLVGGMSCVQVEVLLCCVDLLNVIQVVEVFGVVYVMEGVMLGGVYFYK